jgi:hypothetical protein
VKRVLGKVGAVLGDGSEEMSEDMMTVVRALSARKELWAVVTAVLPIVAVVDETSPELIREQYSEVFAGLGMDADNERDLALLTGAVESAKWILMAAELAGVDPERFWQSYIARSAAA